MPFPTDTFAARNPGPNDCDRCGRTVHGDNLLYCDWTGEALCDPCSMLRYEQECDCEDENALRQAFPAHFAAHAKLVERVAELEKQLKFANDTSEMVLELLAKRPMPMGG